MRLACLFTAAAFALVAVSGTAHAQATPPAQKSDGQMESAGQTAPKKAVKSKRGKKSSKKMTQ